MSKCLSFKGNIRKDHFGRIVIDTCGSDLDHIVSSVVSEGDDRARCRVLLEDFFDEYVGQKGKMSVDITFYEDFYDE